MSVNSINDIWAAVLEVLGPQLTPTAMATWFSDCVPIEIEGTDFAIQIGKTYGGGFKITPDAELDDGYFNMCFSSGNLTRKKALPLFARAAKGKHVGSKYVDFAKSKNIRLHIDQLVPCQLDGEEYSNHDFDIKTHPKALRVYVAS